MLIGVPKEIKVHEYRVGLVPESVRELIERGHQVLVETGAGFGIGVCDADYKAVGAQIAQTASEVFAQAQLIVKVKEPQASEWVLLREGQILFTYLHLAADRPQTLGLMQSKCVAIAYETVTDKNGGLPLLAPMSEVAGRMSIQVGACFLEKSQGGAGILLGGVPGVSPAKVTIIGGGIAGTSAALMAIGLGAKVTIIDKSLPRLRQLNEQFGSRIETLYSTSAAIERSVASSDLVIGAVLLPGAAAPKLVTLEMISQMRKGSVLVDIAIDQGGCFETSRPTTHEDPVFMVEDKIHYCVTNMPGAVSRTSAFALNNATLPYILKLADHGYERALKEDMHLRAGLNIYRGMVTNSQVAKSLNLPFHDMGHFEEMPVVPLAVAR